MAKVSTFSAYGNNFGFSKQADSSKYFKSGSVTSGKLGREVFRGEYSNAPGLSAFDTTSNFINQGSRSSQNNSSSLSPSTNPPSSRPYIWKYQ